jgi:hypothetical protein
MLLVVESSRLLHVCLLCCLCGCMIHGSAGTPYTLFHQPHRCLLYVWRTLHMGPVTPVVQAPHVVYSSKSSVKYHEIMCQVTKDQLKHRLQDLCLTRQV